MSRPSESAVRVLVVLSVMYSLLAHIAMADDSVPPTPSVHIVLAGDSTVTDQVGWGTGFAACLADHVKCTNLSRGGRSSSSFRDEGSWDKVLALKPDWVLIQFGHNDQAKIPGIGNDPETSYRENMTRFVEEAIAAGIKPVLVTPIGRRQWGKEEGMRDRIVSSLQPWVDVVKAIAAEKNVPLIDLHARSIEVYQSLGPKGCEMITYRKENGQWDGTHMNHAGAVMFGSMVAMDSGHIVPGMNRHVRTSKLMALQARNRPPSMSEVDVKSLYAKGGERVSKGVHRYTVAHDGTGDFRTLQDAIAAAPMQNADRTFITLKPGIYMGQIIIPANKPNITLIGEDRDACIISYALTQHDPIPPEVPRHLAGIGLVALADGFQATNLTFRQMAGDHGQAIALRIDGDRAIVQNCNVLGWQDTLRLETGRQYFRDCYIEGRVDYIYGNATAVFENCTLHTKHSGYITAASTSPDRLWGFVFLRCKLTGLEPNTVFLGRPWRPHASVTYLYCEMDSSIRPAGWDNWRDPAREKTVRYGEFGSTGPGAAAAQRVEWARPMSESDAQTMVIPAILGGEDGWNVFEESAKLQSLTGQ